MEPQEKYGRWHQGRVGVLGLLLLGLTLVCGLNSAQWIGQAFPGFVVLQNRVIASVSLPHWAVAARPQLYKQTVTAVNGQAVQTADELYAAVRPLPSGAAVTYTLEHDGHMTEVSVPAQPFTGKDYGLLFGAYLLNGVLVALIGLVVWSRNPSNPTSRALLGLGLTTGIWALTAADLYGPHWFFRLHVLAEALLPAAFLHLALALPGTGRARWVWLPYLLASGLAVAYEVALADPGAYAYMQHVCMGAAGISLVGLISKIGWQCWSTRSLHLRDQLRVLLIGAVNGYSFPIFLALASSLSGGAMAVNYAAFTAFCFPLSLGYVLLRADRFTAATDTPENRASVAAQDEVMAAESTDLQVRRPYGWRAGIVCTLLLLTLGLAATGGLTSGHWIGKPFPGFVVLANRVIASVSLPHWTIATHTDLYQQVVVAVNEQSVQTPAALYAAIRQLPPGSEITYTLEKDGQSSQVTLSSQLFTTTDYGLLFGAYLVNGLAFAGIGLAVWGMRRITAASHALLLVGVTIGLFAVTAVDLYAPYSFFRLHVLGEAFFPASLIHLALVFPRNHLKGRNVLWLSVPYFAAASLGWLYEVLMYQPQAYSMIHNLCMVYAGIACLTLISSTLWQVWTETAPRMRQQIRMVGLGCLSAYGLPALLMFASGVTGGAVGVNYTAFTAFLFPLILGVVMVKQNLDPLETLLKRGALIASLFLVITLAYGVLSPEATAHVTQIVGAP